MARTTGGGNTQNVSPAKTTTTAANRASAARQEASTTSNTLSPAQIQQIKNVGAARMPSTVVNPPADTNPPSGPPAYDPNAYDPNAATPALMAPSGEELAKLGENDTAYQLRLKGLSDALAAYEADQSSQKTRYNTSYKDSLKSLGWGFDPSKDIAETDVVPTMDELLNRGTWNQGDRTTASGRGISNQLEDFAARGMTDSSFFARAKNDLMKSLNDQLYSTVNSRKSFVDDLASQRRAYGVEDATNRQAALEEAKNRVLSQWALNNA